MYDYKTILMKSVTLFYRQSQASEVSESDDLIKTILDTINTDQPDINFNGHNYIKDLKDFLLELINKKEDINKEVFLQHLKLILQADEKFYTAIEQGILPEYDEGTDKRVILSLIKYLNNYYKEYVVINLINKANYELKFNRNKIPNVFDYVSNLFTQLEPLSANSSMKDPALISEIDLVSEESLNTIFSEIKKSANGTVVFKTGWQDLNIMLQGGFRRGEFATIGALQHKYKTGFSLSIFMQIALYNKPIMLNENKKPLLLRISFEDSLLNNLQFMYQYLRCHDAEPFDAKELETIAVEDMSKYVMQRLSVNGFHIKLMRVDPTQWTYRDICNKIIELEALGYEVQLMMLDYLALIPTTGCTTGPYGTDRRDQFRRIRNFCSSKNIAVVTPHQLSTESKQIIRAGIVPEAYFVKEIAEKGYYDGVKSLDQEIDVELYIHLFNHKRKTYLAVQRGKHRLPTVIDPDDKFFMLSFNSKNMPILEDINDKNSAIKTLPKDVASNNSILTELLG